MSENNSSGSALEEILGNSGQELPAELLNLDEFLAQSPLFSCLDTDGRQELASKSRHRMVKAGETVITEGTRGESFAIIKSGTLNVDATFEGETKRLAELGPGSVVGEVAVIMGTPRTATVTAQNDSELFEFSGDDVRPLFGKYPELKAQLQNLIEERTDQTIEVFLGK